jgi:hypothetical protein
LLQGSRYTLCAIYYDGVPYRDTLLLQGLGQRITNYSVEGLWLPSVPNTAAADARTSRTAAAAAGWQLLELAQSVGHKRIIEVCPAAAASFAGCPTTARLSALRFTVHAVAGAIPSASMRSVAVYGGEACALPSAPPHAPCELLQDYAFAGARLPALPVSERAFSDTPPCKKTHGVYICGVSYREGCLETLTIEARLERGGVLCGVPCREGQGLRGVQARGAARGGGAAKLRQRVQAVQGARRRAEGERGCQRLADLGLTGICFWFVCTVLL